ncbi:MAG: MBL fold metallo-hydrolase [Chitinispirillia bacterium]|nr:MBL fold metallo-hydrolase [Chitinispirillia bacterium]MCL2241667.1 MBL fold metallo-hydrolase [Chitinispirillia bacterium]
MSILRDRQAIRFNIVLTFISLFLNCGGNPVNTSGGGSRFTFAVADVGQGLAQFGVIDGRAAVWDMGPPNQYPSWRLAYNDLGRPRIESIIISHSDADHCGGLQSIDGGIDWTGLIITTPYEDTAKIRAGSGVWSDRVIFRLVTAGDTLKYLNNVEIICLWPPGGIDIGLPLDGRERNHYSLVFSVRHGYSSVLITSDIDSAAMASIAAQSGYELRAQILSAPHHGSAGSVCPLFFSYVSAETAVISCAAQNSYGHPSIRMINELMHQGAKLMYTYLDNTVTFTSNGYYW